MGERREILFEAKWATGFFADRRWFSANRSLAVVVTAREIRTRLMFPYSLLSATDWGFKQTIPISRVRAVAPARFLGWWPTVRLEFQDADGRRRCLELGFTGPLPQIGTSQARKREAFLRAVDAARASGQQDEESGPA